VGEVAGAPSIIAPEMNSRGPTAVPSSIAERSATSESVTPPTSRTEVTP